MNIPKMNEIVEINFPQGLVGAPGWHLFTLENVYNSLIWKLSSHDNVHIDYIAIAPALIEHDYECELSDEDMRILKATENDEIIAVCILNLKNKDKGEATANLLGPLVINFTTGLGHQVVLAESKYSVRTPLPASLFNQASEQWHSNENWRPDHVGVTP